MTVSPRPFFVGVYVALFAFIPAYLIGVSRGNMLWRPVGEVCPDRALADHGPRITDSVFPLSNRCHWQDGTSTELVPTSANALLFIILALAVTLFGLGTWVAVRNRTRRSTLGGLGHTTST